MLRSSQRNNHSKVPQPCICKGCARTPATKLNSRLQWARWRRQTVIVWVMIPECWALPLREKLHQPRLHDARWRQAVATKSESTKSGSRVRECNANFDLQILVKFCKGYRYVLVLRVAVISEVDNCETTCLGLSSLKMHAWASRWRSYMSGSCVDCTVCLCGAVVKTGAGSLLCHNCVHGCSCCGLGCLARTAA